VPLFSLFENKNWVTWLTISFCINPGCYMLYNRNDGNHCGGTWDIFFSLWHYPELLNIDNHLICNYELYVYGFHAILENYRVNQYLHCQWFVIIHSFFPISFGFLSSFGVFVFWYSNAEEASLVMMRPRLCTSGVASTDHGKIQIFIYLFILSCVLINSCLAPFFFHFGS